VPRDRLSYYARKYGIPLWLARAQISKESGGRDSATSPAGAVGRTQVMPATAAGMWGISEAEAARRLRNPEFALETWGRYMHKAFKSFGRWDLALAAYNAGFGAVTSGKWRSYSETTDYVKTIMGQRQASADVGGGMTPPAGSGGSPVTPGAAAPTDLDPLGVSAQEGLDMLRQGSYSPSRALQSLIHASAKAPPPPIAQNGLQRLPGGKQPQVHFQGKASARDRRAAAFVRQAMGTPYVWGGESPGGFDCSGLLQWAWGKIGVHIPRVSQDQWRAGSAVKGSLRLGDAVFFGSRSGPHHVGFYIGGGKFIEAAHTGTNVRISRLKGRRDYIGARRFA
jgi:hypothetical protein